jgi:hypothetical protein
MSELAVITTDRFDSWNLRLENLYYKNARPYAPLLAYRNFGEYYITSGFSFTTYSVQRKETFTDCFLSHNNPSCCQLNYKIKGEDYDITCYYSYLIGNNKEVLAVLGYPTNKKTKCLYSDVVVIISVDMRDKPEYKNYCKYLVQHLNHSVFKDSEIIYVNDIYKFTLGNNIKVYDTGKLETLQIFNNEFLPSLLTLDNGAGED